MKITFEGHSSFIIETEKKVIYINPQSREGLRKKADLVLISGFDSVSGYKFEYYHPGGVDQVQNDETKFISSREVAKFINGCQIIEERDEIDLDYVSIKAIPAYHLKKPEKRSFGFLLHLEGKTLYYTGLTDLIPEIETAKVNILIVCIGGRYMMNAKTAAEFAKSVECDLAIPSHYGKFSGSQDDADIFVEELSEITKMKKMKVKALSEGESVHA